MTLGELWTLLKAQWKLVVGITLGCTLICAAYALLATPSYVASATLVVNGQFTFARGLASITATNDSTDSTSVSVSADTSTNSLTFTASADTAQHAIAGANDAAEDTRSAVRASYPDVVMTLSTADAASEDSPSVKKYTAVGFLGGLFLGVLVVVFIDLARKRIHSWTSVEEHAQVPYLGTCGGTRAEQEVLAAAISLAGRTGEAPASTVCIIPVGETQAAAALARQLAVVPGYASMAVATTEPLSRGAEALFAARQADTTILAIEQEVSTFPALESTVRDLTIAGVKPAGFVYAVRATNGSSQSARPGATPAAQPIASPVVMQGDRQGVQQVSRRGAAQNTRQIPRH